MVVSSTRACPSSKHRKRRGTTARSDRDLALTYVFGLLSDSDDVVESVLLVGFGRVNGWAVLHSAAADGSIVRVLT